MLSMPEGAGPDVTLNTLHGDLGDLKADMREVKADVREVKTLIASGLRAFADWPGEVIRLLRENNRLTEGRFAQLDATLREQALETNTALRALTESHRQLDVTLREEAVETHTALRALADSHRQLDVSHGALVTEIRALIVRIDAIIRGRGNGRSR